MNTLWRNEEYSEGVRNAVKVITFEMYDLGNIDIPDTVFHRYIVYNRSRLEQHGFAKAIEQIELFVNDTQDFDSKQYMLELPRAIYQKVAEDIIAIIQTITGVEIKYVLWLTDKESVVRYYEGRDDNMIEYPTTEIVLSDLGKEGKLFGYNSLPIPCMFSERK